MNNTELLDLAKKSLNTEIEELIKVKDRLGEEFIRSVEKIHQCEGKLVIVGIGKSAHTGRKIVATLNSTGTPSQFMHASEAVHGDLGILTNHDIVLCISNSGNSPEIENLAPILKSYSSCLIAMTGNLESKLAKLSDLVIDSSVDKEACPNEIAPTSSTTVQMVLGDALAICLMKLNNFKKNDFAKFHPGGSLGKNLTLTVEQLLAENKPKVYKTSSIKDVIISISSSKHGITVVFDEDEKIVGVITDGDLRRMLLKNENMSDCFAQDIMSKNPKVIDKKTLAKDALKMIKQRNIGQLVVMDQAEYCGIIDIHKLLNEGIT